MNGFGPPGVDTGTGVCGLVPNSPVPGAGREKSENRSLLLDVKDALSLQSKMPMPAAPDTLDGWAKGAQLFHGLGSFHRKITTRSPLAQKYFDQGMRFIWAFNHDEATRSFAKAAQIDPRCASCFWGVALTLGPNYNMPMMSSPRAQVGWAAVRKAEANARRATPVERALIAAVAKRYRSAGEVDPSNSAPLLNAYVDAMRRVAAKYPNDLDVQTMYAEALMNTNPWKLWKPDGTPNPGTEQVLSTLRHEPVFRSGTKVDRTPADPSLGAVGAGSNAGPHFYLGQPYSI